MDLDIVPFILLPPDCITTAFYNADMKINTKSILWMNLFLQRLQNSMQSQQVVRTMWVLDWVPWNWIPRPLWWRAFNQDKLLWSIFTWIFLFLYGPLPQSTESGASTHFLQLFTVWRNPVFSTGTTHVAAFPCRSTLCIVDQRSSWASWASVSFTEHFQSLFFALFLLIREVLLSSYLPVPVMWT